MSIEVWTWLLREFLVPIAIGRVVLSVLPASSIGSHRLGSLPATIAASFGLGTAALVLERGIWSACGGDPWSPWLSAPWIALLVARWATLPAGLVPRHRAPHARLARLDWAIVVASSACAGLLVLRPGSEQSLEPAELVARRDALVCIFFAGLLLLEAARAARRAPTAAALGMGIWWILAAELELANHMQTNGWMAVQVAMAMLGLVAWLRLADRRGLALAVLGFAALSALEPLIAGVALAWLVIGSSAPSRRLVLGWSLLAFTAFSCLRWVAIDGAQVTHAALPSAARAAGSGLRLAPLVLAFVALFSLIWNRRRDHPISPPRIDPPLREAALAAGIVLSALILVLLPVSLRGSRWTASPDVFPVWMLGPFILLTLLVYAPDEDRRLFTGLR